VGRGRHQPGRIIQTERTLTTGIDRDDVMGINEGPERGRAWVTSTGAALSPRQSRQQRGAAGGRMSMLIPGIPHRPTWP